VKTLTIRNKIAKILDNPETTARQKHEALVMLYTREKQLTLNLSDAGYRIKKINLLRRIIFLAQSKVLTDNFTVK